MWRCCCSSSFSACLSSRPPRATAATRALSTSNIDSLAATNAYTQYPDNQYLLTSGVDYAHLHRAELANPDWRPARRAAGTRPIHVRHTCRILLPGTVVRAHRPRIVVTIQYYHYRHLLGPAGCCTAGNTTAFSPLATAFCKSATSSSENDVGRGGLRHTYRLYRLAA